SPCRLKEQSCRRIEPIIEKSRRASRRGQPTGSPLWWVSWSSGSTGEVSRPASLVRTLSTSEWLSSSKMVRAACHASRAAWWLPVLWCVSPRRGEGVGLVVAVAEVAEQGESMLVTREGLGAVAEVLVGVAQAVPRLGLPEAVVEFLEQGEGLL